LSVTTTRGTTLVFFIRRRTPCDRPGDHGRRRSRTDLTPRRLRDRMP
jgi:hypothetical protein